MTTIKKIRPVPMGEFEYQSAVEYATKNGFGSFSELVRKSLDEKMEKEVSPLAQKLASLAPLVESLLEARTRDEGLLSSVHIFVNSMGVHVTASAHTQDRQMDIDGHGSLTIRGENHQLLDKNMGELTRAIVSNSVSKVGGLG